MYGMVTRQKGPKQDMTPLKPVSRTTLVEQVAHQVLRMISEGRWKAGEKLPSESELCRGFHVGRSTLREALRSLAFAGMLRMRAGDGTYVAEGPSSILGRVFAPGLLKTEKDMNDLFEARRVLEGGAATLCAERATEEDLQNLERLAKELQLYPSDPAGRDQELDVAFHLAIAAASKNEILAQVLGAIRHLIREAVAKSRQLPGSHQLACDQHLEIVQALKERNPRKARRAIHRHLWSFEQVYEIFAHAPKSEPEAQDHEVRQAQESRA
jgi:GntR family transcriptional repressor for pyruvate dehydrogenase complex